MNVLTREPLLSIDSSDPFGEDRYESRQIFESFFSSIKMTGTPFVYALTAPWGSGKSTFIKMSSAELVKRGYSSFVINVWSDDHLLDSREAFVSQLFSILRNINKITIAKTKVGKVLKSIKEPTLKLVELAGKLYFKNSEFSASGFFDSLGMSSDDIKEIGPQISNELAKKIFSQIDRNVIYSEMKLNLQRVVDDHIKQIYADNDCTGSPKSGIIG